MRSHGARTLESSAKARLAPSQCFPSHAEGWAGAHVREIPKLILAAVEEEVTRTVPRTVEGMIETLRHLPRLLELLVETRGVAESDRTKRRVPSGAERPA